MQFLSFLFITFTYFDFKHMRNLLLFLFLLILIDVNSQTNLVPNWSFEDIISCPHDQGFTFYSYTPPWFSPNGGTPDLYNSCDNNVTTSDSGLGVPHNWSGYQQAHTGSGYAGFAWEQSDDCEYLSVKLISPLKDGKKYCISFFVNPGNYTYYVIDRIGACISMDSLHTPAFCGYLHYIPQIESPTGVIISDTVNWTEISGEYIAAGGEQYITIGCFRPDSMVQMVYNDTIHPPGMWPYYFLDDVSVYYCGDDTLGVNEIAANKSNFNIYPNPAKDNFSIELLNQIEKNGKAFISVYNIQGQLLIQQPIRQTKTEVDISTLATGVYIVKIEDSTNTIFKRLIKE
jgi:hypothetical protein